MTIVHGCFADQSNLKLMVLKVEFSHRVGIDVNEKEWINSQTIIKG